MLFRARTCSNCGLRFPVQADSHLGDACPHCKAPTEAGEPYETHPAGPAGPGLDSGDSSNSAGAAQPIPPRLAALIDNVRSVRNVGSMFRTADGAGVAHMHLCGFTPTPEHPQMPKTSLGAEKAVGWNQHQNALVAAKELIAGGSRLWALEGGPRSEPLFELASKLTPSSDTSIVLVVGHEVSGVDAQLEALCEKVVHVPMAGIKGSLNVGVAFGVACYFIRYASQLVAPHA